MNRMVVLLVLLIGVPERCLAWGEDGHRIIGEIAWLELSSPVKKRVRAILPEGRYDTLAESATWADTYARLYNTYDYLEPWHYINTPSDAAAVDPDDCGSKGCVIRAIQTTRQQLANGVEHDDVQGLHLLAHFVGDAHQPLHVSHPDGRGGNNTYVWFFGEQERFHRVWDTKIIAYHLRTYYESSDVWEPDAGPGDAWTLYAADLHRRIGPHDRAAWKSDLDPLTWASESLALAKEHAFKIRRGASLSWAFQNRSRPVIERRLQQAGVRLAAVLEQVLAP